MISILIIAAGASRRMGEPKQLLKWKNTTLLGHAIEQALASKADNVNVALGAHFEKIAASIASYSIDVLQNDDWEKGMGNTIAFAVKTLLENRGSEPSQQAILIMLADQPQVSSAYLNQIIEAFVTGKKGIVATDYENAMAGVPAIFDKRYFDSLISLNGDRGAKALIQTRRDDVLAITPPTPLVDIDTKETYLALI